MPFKFTGTIEKVVVKLGEQNLTAGDQKEIDAGLGRLGTEE